MPRSPRSRRHDPRPSAPRVRDARARVLVLLVVPLLAVLLAVGCGGTGTRGGAGAAPPAVPGTSRGTPGVDPIVANATVVRIVDGDTIHVQRNGEEDTVRLIGMDTPETKKPNTAVECFGHEASDHMGTLLPAGTPVRLERDVEERDRYDRVLAYVYREDGVFVNLAMVADGYAGQLTIPPNVAHADELTQAARKAREQGKGLWSACGGNHVARG